MTIKLKLVILGIASILAMSILGGISLSNSFIVKTDLAQSEERIGQIKIVNDMRRENLRLILAAMDSIVDKAEGKISDERMKEIDESIATLNAIKSKLAEIADTDEEKALAAKISNQISELAKGIKIDLAKAIETNASDEEFAKLDDIIDEFGEGMDESLATYEASVQEELNEAAQETHNSVEGAITGISVTFVLSGIVLIGFLYTINRSIMKPIPSVLAAFKAGTEGDLTQNISVANSDEIGSISNSFNNMMGTMRDNISEVGENSTSLAGASEELTASAREMSRHSEQLNNEADGMHEAVDEVTKAITELSSVSGQLAASAETVASASEEMGSSIQEVARHADSSSDVAHQARTVAAEAESVLRNADTAMIESEENVRELLSASEQIGEVVSVISDIAEQTNLLALNATIEAARAGEAGKGFAVVASEVKNLANQTAKATDEITQRISQTQQQTSKTVASIEEVSVGMKEVSGSIATINEVIVQIDDLATAIASEVEQQSQTTRDIGSNVGQVAEAAKTVAADCAKTSEQAQIVQKAFVTLQGIASETSSCSTETSAASDDLARIAHQLDQMVTRYKVI